MKMLCPVCGHTAHLPRVETIRREYDPMTEELVREIHTTTFTCPICKTVNTAAPDLDDQFDEELCGDICADPAVDLFREIHAMAGFDSMKQFIFGWNAAIAAVENLLVERFGLDWEDLDDE